MLVEIPSLADNDHYNNYLAGSSTAYCKALLGVSFDIFITPALNNREITGFAEAENCLIKRFLEGSYDYLNVESLNSARS